MDSVSDLDLQRSVNYAMLSSERFLEALMQETPLGAPIAREVYDYHTGHNESRKVNDHE